MGTRQDDNDNADHDYDVRIMMVSVKSLPTLNL